MQSEFINPILSCILVLLILSLTAGIRNALKHI